ncbi:MAG: hypothetical protein GY895_05110, partial [Phycisphaera sp.]|nr:hypothetical protein [Phycisphaera sp.]
MISTPRTPETPLVVRTEHLDPEAEAWIALGGHPNICTALYVQEIGGMPRLFIEYVDGGDLDGV